ncbi:hypothetical protein [Nocardia sp. NPDC057455]|uniref:hypothetical protein n=1 Tax=Nocardia sp. NPDC057455 TaxID=3346138 RepID=UPI00366B6D19
MSKSAQDQLADALKREGDRESSIGFYRDRYWLPIAKRLIAEGWRPPPRRIETVQELDALPIDSVVLAVRSRTVWQNLAELESLWGNGSSALTAKTLLHNYGAVIVLWVPS